MATCMIRRILFLIVLLALSGVARAQGIIPSGSFTPGHTVRCQNSTCTVVTDAGGAGGATQQGQNYLTELGITNTGTPLCINDALTNSSTGYHQLCFGANALGGGLISYNAYGIAPALPLNIILNGTTYPFPGSGNGNVLGPVSSTVGALALFNNNAGTLLSSAVMSGDATLSPNGQITVSNGSHITNSSIPNSGLAGIGTSGASIGLLNANKTDSGNNTYTGNNSMTGPVYFGGNNTYTGNNSMTGPVYFGGSPWVDVKSGANGCAAAVGNGSANDYTAINCQVQYMNTTYGGGFVWLPVGVYNLNGSTLNIPGAVILQGSGRGVTALENLGDHTVVSFPCGGGLSGCATPTASYGGLRDLTVDCYFNSAATQDCITIGDNNNVYIRDINAFGGRAGLYSAGSDGTVEDSYITGYTYGLLSSGANWYIRDKFDGPQGSGVTTTYAIFQGLPFSGLSIAENHFTQTDTSGPWSFSLEVDDTTGSTVTAFDQGVLADEINMQDYGILQLTGNELGSSFNIATNAKATVVANYASSLTIGVAGTLKCAANIGITNMGC